ncbi:MAG TPA: GntR family transcriptional regulator [Opitutaceae bacterium]|nr:GntR family transcriptional regulator [Opitutaceae bacterium]
MSGPHPRDARLPRYHQLRDVIAGEIARRRWRPEEAIPTEAELAQEHGVSIGTLRKAIDLLVAEGVLERQQGRGTFVRRPQFNASLFRFFRFGRDDGPARVPSSRIVRREVKPPPSAVAAALHLPREAEGIHFARLRSLDDRPLLLESIWLPRHRFEPLLKIDPREFGDLLYPLYEQYCGVVVASAEETLTAEAASAKDARALAIEPGAPIIVIDRVALAFDREPVEWRCSRGPADKFRYQAEIR